jgi:hypothetical protein
MTYYLPDDAVYVLTYEYWSKPEGAIVGEWKQAQPRAFTTAKAANEAWAGMLELRGGRQYRRMQVTPINVYI